MRAAGYRERVLDAQADAVVALQQCASFKWPPEDPREWSEEEFCEFLTLDANRRRVMARCYAAEALEKAAG